MKSMISTSTHAFYHSAPAVTGTWYTPPRPDARRKATPNHYVTFEQEDRKQEIVCSVILAACLLVAFAECVVQFAVS